MTVQPTTKVERMYRPAEVAEHLGKSRAWVYEQIEAGYIKYKLVGESKRVPESALNEYIANLPGTC